MGKVASGGELSRIALAIAVTTSALGQAQTLIFDEVDSGVGGAVAETVGRLMQQLGADRQVLAVTHLPQVAACAHHHWLVTKRSDKTGSFSQLQAVAADERVQEIARMLGDGKQDRGPHAGTHDRDLSRDRGALDPPAHFGDRMIDAALAVFSASPHRAAGVDHDDGRAAHARAEARVTEERDILKKAAAYLPDSPGEVHIHARTSAAISGHQHVSCA